MSAGHFIVCGLGHVGSRVVELLGRLGEPVTAVTLETHDEWAAAAQARGVRLVIGDARDARLLEAAGLREARALIAATDQDLVNLEIAFDARRMRPDLPIVVRLFDQTLARQVEAALDLNRALGMAALAAPTFATAALGEQIAASFTLEGRLFVIGRLNLEAASPLAGLTVRQASEQFHLTPLSHERRVEEQALAPRGETGLQAGNRVTVLGEANAWHRLTSGFGVFDERPFAWQAERGAPRSALAGLLRLDFFRQVWSNAPAPLRALFIAFNLLILFSVFLFHQFMQLSPVDAFYFVVTTVTTVGYGDFNAHDATPWVKLYACFVMVLGSATIATLYSILTDFIVTERFRQLLGRERVPRDGHIVVVGLGNVGYRVVEELVRAGARVAAVERNADRDFVQAVRAMDTPVVVGDARVRETLVKAGVESAHAVLVVTNDDAVNLGVGLLAEQMNPRARTVVRLFDPDFARKAQESLSIDVTVSASMIAVPTFVAAALYRGVDAAFELDDWLFIVFHRTAGTEWHGHTPAQLRAAGEISVVLRHRPNTHTYVLADDNTPLYREEKVLALQCRELRTRDT